MSTRQAEYRALVARYMAAGGRPTTPAESRRRISAAAAAWRAQNRARRRNPDEAPTRRTPVERDNAKMLRAGLILGLALNASALVTTVGNLLRGKPPASPPTVAVPPLPVK